MTKKVCCFTGHRELPVGEKLKKLQAVLKHHISRLADSGFETFIAGGALGFDMLAACTVLSLKARYPDIKLKIALPCKKSGSQWRYDSLVVQAMIVESADETILVSENYFDGCMQKRNEYMVDASDYCIAYLHKDSGGTFYTVNEARRKGIEVLNLYKLI